MEAWFAAEHHDAAALDVVRRRAEPPRRLRTSPGLAKLFSVHKQTLRVVVLNACYSQELADLLVADIDCVVGMTEAIDDEAAILFSEVFYDALFDGAAVGDAFDNPSSHSKPFFTKLSMWYSVRGFFASRIRWTGSQ